MKVWKMPQSWTVQKRAAHERGLEFLKSICDSSQHMETYDLQNGLPSVRIKSTSRRWYSLQAVPEKTIYENLVGEMKDGIVWSFDIRAAPRKTDLLALNDYSVRLCIYPEHGSKNLPIGDQLATLALGLRDDRRTAVRIGLLAQFVIAPRDALLDVYKFTAEGAVYNEEVFYDDEFEYEPNERRPNQHFLLNPTHEADQISETFADDDQACANEYEHINFQEWFDKNEEVACTKEEIPWHHDENQIWDIEEAFLRGLE